MLECPTYGAFREVNHQVYFCRLYTKSKYSRMYVVVDDAWRRKFFETSNNSPLKLNFK